MHPSRFRTQTKSDALLIAVASGVLPALTLTQSDGMRHASNRVASGRSRWQSVAIALQACLSVVLMAGAGLMIRSLMNEQRVNPGFRVANMLTLRVQLPGSAEQSTADLLRLYTIAQHAIEGLPGVVRATAVLTPPLSGRTNGQSITPLVSANASTPTGGEAERQVVLPNYFDVLGIPILKGRTFTNQDVAGSQLVAVVSEGFARRFWPGQSALGKQFKAPAGVATIVGIARDLRNKSVARTPESVFYLSHLQEPSSLSFIAETRGDPLLHAGAVQRAVWSAIPGATVSAVTSLDALLDRSLAPTRYRALLAGLFAVLALLLTAVGLAGLTARSVATRMRELSIRMAIGATPRRVLVAALGGALAAVSAGLAAGLVAAPFSTRFFSVYLFEVGGRDLATYAATTVIALLVCMVTTYLATARLRGANLVAVLKDEA